MNKPTWLQRAEKLDFDPQDAAKNRVWARVSQRRVIAWRRPLAWAGCAAFVLVLGAALLPRLPLPRAQAPAAEQGLSEEDCAELNSRYLLAKALTDSEGCPCERQLNSFDRRTVLHLRKGLEEVACTACTADEQARLKQCAAKYPSQLKELKLCKTLC